MPDLSPQERYFLSYATRDDNPSMNKDEFLEMIMSVDNNGDGKPQLGEIQKLLALSNVDISSVAGTAAGACNIATNKDCCKRDMLDSDVNFSYQQIADYVYRTPWFNPFRDGMPMDYGTIKERLTGFSKLSGYYYK